MSKRKTNFSFTTATWKVFAVLIAVSLLSLSTAAKDLQSNKKPAQANATETAQLFGSAKIPVEGMSCMSCVAALKKAIRGMDGVTKVEVSLAERNVKVEYLSSKVTAQTVAQKINELGYKTGNIEPVGK
jgi:copper ion binding protein